MKNQNSKKKIYRAISIISGCIALAALFALGGFFLYIQKAENDYRALAATAYAQATDDSSEQPLIPIDFDYLQGVNSDVIGWVIVDGTDINYPVLYDADGELFYLNHTYTGAYQFSGSIFVENINTPDFSDFNTILYGHNLTNGSMFAQLLYFEDKAFFESHDSIIIYTPESKLTYHIFAAYRTDKQNILTSNNFRAALGRQVYLNQVFDHADALFDADISVAETDKIITLSTCVGNLSARYVVQGVLVSEERDI